MKQLDRKLVRVSNVVVWCRIKIWSNLTFFGWTCTKVVVWCRIKIWSNVYPHLLVIDCVVVWCRIKIWNNNIFERLKHGWLWFDVESRYETTLPLGARWRHLVVVWCRIKIWNNRTLNKEIRQQVVVWCRIKIWSNTRLCYCIRCMLWFDVESKYEATDEIELMYELRCGLM